MGLVLDWGVHLLQKVDHIYSVVELDVVELVADRQIDQELVVIRLGHWVVIHIEQGVMNRVEQYYDLELTAHTSSGLSVLLELLESQHLGVEVATQIVSYECLLTVVDKGEFVFIDVGMLTCRGMCVGFSL